MAVASGGAKSQGRVVIVSEDDDVTEPLEALLLRSGYVVDVLGGREGTETLREPDGLPDALILDRDLRPDHYRAILDNLASRGGPDSFPLLVLGGGAAPEVPAGWHEDAFASVGRPPHAGEVLATLAFLRRLAVYRRYRDLVHDLAQPVTAIHALVRSLSKLEPKEAAASARGRTIDRLSEESERLMSLLETFQRSRES